MGGLTRVKETFVGHGDVCSLFWLWRKWYAPQPFSGTANPLNSMKSRSSLSRLDSRWWAWAVASQGVANRSHWSSQVRAWCRYLLHIQPQPGAQEHNLPTSTAHFSAISGKMEVGQTWIEITGPLLMLLIALILSKPWLALIWTNNIDSRAIKTPKLAHSSGNPYPVPSCLARA